MWAQPGDVGTYEGQGLGMLRIDAVTKRYDAQLALDDVSVSLERGTVTGLVGENGAGKSTLLNIVSGITQPDSGEIFLDGQRIEPRGYKAANGLGVWRVFQEPALIGGIPLYENLFLGHEAAFSRRGLVSHSRMIRAAKRIVDEFGIHVDVTRLTSEFSYSVRQAAEAVKATAVPDVLGLPRAFVLFDEPTAALSHEEVPHLLLLVKQLAERGLGVVFVSHRLKEVLEVCSDIVVLKDGAVVAQMKAESTDEAALHELMVGRVRQADFHAEARQGSGLRDRIVLSTRRAGCRDRGQHNRADAQRFVFRDVSFDLRQGEILGIGGLIGSGKSSLARSLAGAHRMDEGQVTLNGATLNHPSTVRMKRHGVVYLSPDRHADSLIQTHSVKSNISLPSGTRDKYGFVRRGGIWKSRLERSEAIAAIKIYDIKATNNMTISHLSGGNQQKVALSKWTRREPTVLILENPTAGVDVGAKGEIYSILRGLSEAGTAILIVSDDLPELIGLSDRILVMRNGGIVATVDASRESKPDEAYVIGLMA